MNSADLPNNGPPSSFTNKLSELLLMNANKHKDIYLEHSNVTAPGSSHIMDSAEGFTKNGISSPDSLALTGKNKGEPDACRKNLMALCDDQLSSKVNNEEKKEEAPIQEETGFLQSTADNKEENIADYEAGAPDLHVSGCNVSGCPQNQQDVSGCNVSGCTQNQQDDSKTLVEGDMAQCVDHLSAEAEEQQNAENGSISCMECAEDKSPEVTLQTCLPHTEAVEETNLTMSSHNDEEFRSLDGQRNKEKEQGDEEAANSSKEQGQKKGVHPEADIVETTNASVDQVSNCTDNDGDDGDDVLAERDGQDVSCAPTKAIYVTTSPSAPEHNNCSEDHLMSAKVNFIPPESRNASNVHSGSRGFDLIMTVSDVLENYSELKGPADIEEARSCSSDCKMGPIDIEEEPIQHGEQLQRENGEDILETTLSQREALFSIVRDREDCISLPQTETVDAKASHCPVNSEIHPFTVREGRTLAWQNVNLVVRSGRRPDRKILDNVSGVAPKKETTAIMGGSGAGKTSLLNILAGRMRSGGRIHMQAQVRLDDYIIDPNNMAIRQMIAFVAQDDALPITATPRESIWFSAKLRLGRTMTDEQLKSLTERMLDELGLKHCADTLVGGLLVKGISGGERKRTSVGVELVVKPAVVFLDEPTSGLDAFSAVQVCRLLRKVAQAGATVMFTIHQPSSRVFREFDRLILLSKGRTVYQGHVSGVEDFFGNRGYRCPKNYNPADWIMKVAQKVSDGIDQSVILTKDESVVKEFSAQKARCDALERSIHRHNSKQSRPLSFAKQVSLLVGREMRHIRRDKMASITPILINVVSSVTVGMVFFNVGQSSTASFVNLHSQFGGIVLIATNAMIVPAQTALLAFAEDRPIFLREYYTKHYSAMAYFLSRLVMETLSAAVQNIVAVTISFYMMNFKGSIILFYGAYFALSMGTVAIALALGAACGASVELANSMQLITVQPQFLFVGYFVAPELIPVWLRWVHYLCPITYATRILLVDEFNNCSDNPFKKLGCDLMLLNLNANPDDVWWYWLILIAQFILFCLVAFVVVYCKAKKFY